MTNEELTGKAGGVGDLSAPSPPPGGGEGGEGATAPAAPAIAEEKKVDLSKLEEFRSWQAARDRREAQLQTQLQDQGRQVEEMQREVARLRLVDADPDEVSAYYQQQMAQMQEAQRVQAAQVAQREELKTRAVALLEDVGLEPDTPGLDWAAEPSEDGLVRLAVSAARIKALQLQELAKGQGAVLLDTAQAAKVQALTAAGVAQVSTATGAAIPTDLKAEYEAAKAALVGTGDVGALVRLRTTYRQKGLEV